MRRSCGMLAPTPPPAWDPETLASPLPFQGHRPEERLTRVRLLAWFLAGIYTSRSVQLYRVALKIPSSAQLASVTRRLRRFLDNPRVRVRPCYEPMARPLLEECARSIGEIRLILDTASVGPSHLLLLVALACRRRAIPLAWTWLRQKEGFSAARLHLALLRYVRTLLPRHTPVLVVGDTESGAMQVLKQLDGWGWQFPGTGRQGQVCLAPKSQFQSLPERQADLANLESPGQSSRGKGLARTSSSDRPEAPTGQPPRLANSRREGSLALGDPIGVCQPSQTPP